MNIVLGIGMGACISAVIVYLVMQSQARTGEGGGVRNMAQTQMEQMNRMQSEMQSLKTQLQTRNPYHYEIERDEKGRLSGVSYLPG